MLIRIAALREYGWRGNAAKQENGGGARHPWHSPSLYFWPSIGLRWPKRKGAAERCAYVPIAARPQPTVWAGVVGFRRSVIHVGVHSPRVRYARSLLRETDCIQRRSAQRKAALGAHEAHGVSRSGTSEEF